MHTPCPNCHCSSDMANAINVFKNFSYLGDYFLANGGQSCDDPCEAAGMLCDLDKAECCGGLLLILNPTN